MTMKRLCCLHAPLLALWMLASPLPQGTPYIEDPHSKNFHPKGHDIDPALFFQNIHSDLAFWGRLAFQGTYDGFRIVDITEHGNPKLVIKFKCNGNQGDVSVWQHLLFRSIDQPQTTDTCDSEDMPQDVPGFEGIQIFDIRDPANPIFLKAVPVDCGSHTQTLVPDLKNNRVLIYVSSWTSNFIGLSPFGNNCQPVHEKIPIVAVPLDNPQAASVIGNMPLPGANHCHDIAVHLGVHRAVGACNPFYNMVWDISDPANPVALYKFSHPLVPYWHSASFTWDGRVMVMGWEPGGGVQPHCQATSPDVEKSIFFFDTYTGVLLGTWVLQRPQSDTENCTIHNYNVVPLRGRYVLVHGSYQSGVSVVDFTNLTNAFEVGFDDPPPLVPAQLGGAWSAYWYNGFIYESDITKGLNVFKLTNKATARAKKLDHLNPQTQEMVIEDEDEDDDHDDRRIRDHDVDG